MDDQREPERTPTVTEHLLEKYPQHLVEYVRQVLGLELHDTSEDQYILNLSRFEFLERVCNWNGLVNYGSTIKGWMEDIYNIDLDGGADRKHQAELTEAINANKYTDPEYSVYEAETDAEDNKEPSEGETDETSK